ncbi:hypothetical protein [Actinomadura monticuli]|uniref:Uncharacterized protein n=1 Tax=Actinomadura monticuli TaxID=3097367 RepID=A0ABV4QDM3_9ACTN
MLVGLSGAGRIEIGTFLEMAAGNAPSPRTVDEAEAFLVAEAATAPLREGRRVQPAELR